MSHQNTHFQRRRLNDLSDQDYVADSAQFKVSVALTVEGIQTKIVPPDYNYATPIYCYSIIMLIV